MAISQINSADFNYATMLATINAAYVGKAEITLSNFDGTGAPDVKVGSKFEDNGALFKVLTADETPTGYAGITNSTTFYLYYDESGGAFIYSNTAPTWNDTLQGWYNGNDRAFFSIFKDSGGTLYEHKTLLLGQNNVDFGGGVNTDNMTLKTKVIEIGDWNMDTTDFVNVAHGLTGTSIRAILSVFIRRDDDGTNSDFGSYDASESKNISAIIGVNVFLSRLSGGTFDAATYNATSFNRGWITLLYESA